MIYRDFPLEEGRTRFDEIKATPPPKRIVPVIVKKPTIRILTGMDK